MNRQKVALNCCELLIDKAQLPKLGYVYFIWKKGKKHTQSQKYFADGNPIHIRQKLQMKLKTYTVHNQIQQKETHLYLLDSKDHEVWSTSLGVHEWEEHPQKITLQISNSKVKSGSVTLRASKKQLMELQNFIRNTGEIEESSEEERVTLKNEHKLGDNKDSIKVRKELDDANYLIEKLKKERISYLSKNEKLEEENDLIKHKIKGELGRLQEYFMKKIEMRESIFEQSIQELLESFNENYEINSEIIHQLIKEVEQLNLQILQEKRESQQNLKQKQTQHNQKIAELDKESEELIGRIDQLQKQLGALDDQMNEGHEQIKQLNTQIDAITINHSIEKEDIAKKMQQDQNIIKELQEKLKQLNEELTDKDKTIEILKDEIDKEIKKSEEIQAKLHQSDDETNRLNQELIKLSNDCTLKENDIQMLEGKVKDLQTTITEKEQQIEYLQLQRSKIAKEAQQKLRQLDEENEKRQNELLNNIQEMRQQMLNRDAETIRLQTELKEKELEASEYKNHYEELQIETNQRQNEIIKLNEQFTKMQELYSDEKRELIQKNDELSEEIKISQSNFSELETENQRLRTEHQAIQQELTESDHTITLLKQQIQQEHQKNIKNITDIRQQLCEEKERAEADLRRIIEEVQQDRQYYKQELQEQKKQLFDEMAVKLELKETINDMETQMKDYQDMVKKYEELLHQSRENEEQLLKNTLLSSNEEKNKNQNVEPSVIIKESMALRSNDMHLSKYTLNYSEDPQTLAIKTHYQNQIERKSSKVLEFSKQNEELHRKIEELNIQKTSMLNTIDQYGLQIQQLDEQLLYLRKMLDRQEQVVQELKKKLHENKVEHELEERNKQKQRQQIKEQIHKEKKEEQHQPNFEMPIEEAKKPSGRINTEESKQSKEISSPSLRSSRKKKLKKKQFNNQGVQVNTIISSPQRQSPKQYVGYNVSNVHENKEQYFKRNEKRERKVREVDDQSPRIRKMDSTKSINRQELIGLEKEVSVTKNKLGDREEYIEKLQRRNRELFDEMTTCKQEMGIKISMHESKVMEYEKKYGDRQHEKTSFYASENEQLRKGREKLNRKIDELKQTNQQLLLQCKKVKFENEQHLSEVRKLKRDIEDLQRKQKIQVGFDFNKSLQADLQQANKNIIQISKGLHLARMQKENAQEQIGIVKKKLLDLQKRSLSSQERANNLEIELQDEKRKNRKMKRDLQDRQDEVQKYKQQYKKVHDEIQNFSSFNNQNMFEKKKILEEKMEIEDKLNKKDNEIRKIQKELEKYQLRIQESQDYKNSRKNEMRKDIENLEKDLIQASRTIAQYQENIRMLNNRIGFMEKEKKKTLEEQSQTYSHKLNIYVDEIANIKNLLDENEFQAGNLRMENDHLIEENELMRVNLEDFEIKYNKLIEYKEQLEKELESRKEEKEKMMKECSIYEQECKHLSLRMAELQAELDKERMMNAKRTEKVRQYEEVNEKYIYENKNIKIKLKEYEESQNVEKQLTQNMGKLSQENQSIREQLQAILRQYNKYKQKYVYSSNQVEDAMKELNDNYEESKHELLRQQEEKINRENHQNNIKLQAQVLQLFNENAKLGVQLQRKNDGYAELLANYHEIEHYPNQYQNGLTKIQHLQNQIQLLTQRDNELVNKSQRIQNKCKQLERVNENLGHQLSIVTNSYNHEQQKVRKLQYLVSESQTGQELLKQEVTSLRNGKNDKSDSLINKIQTYESRVLSLQLQNERLKQRQQNMYKEYSSNIAKLQSKVKQTNASMSRNIQDLQKQKHKQLHNKSQEINKYNHDIKKLTSSLQSLKSKEDALRQQNQQLSLQLANNRSQLNEDEELYLHEINQLKNKVKNMEEIYNININNLQQQLSHINKELTMEKLKRKNESLGGSRLRQSEVDGRYEEKCKQKEIKISQLKNNIIILEETVIKLRKKETSDDKSHEQKQRVSKYEQLLKQYQIQREEMMRERDKIKQGNKVLKKEIMSMKEKEQGMQLKNDHQLLQLQSQKCELKTVQELYNTLQREVDRRKSKVGEDMEVQNHYQKQIEYKSIKIAELQQKYNQSIAKCESISTKLMKKEHELSAIEQKNGQLLQTVNKLTHHQNSLNISLQTKQTEIQEQKQKIHNIEKENKRLTHQINLLNNKLIEIRNQHGILEKECSNLKNQKEQLKSSVMGNHHQTNSYTELNNKCYQTYGISIEEIINNGFWEQKMFDKDQEINQLHEEIQEIKFMQQRKFLDYDEVKRINFELQVKMEDYDILNEQVDTLRRICDKLEEQKKLGFLRQQTMRMQLQNILPSVSSEAKLKIENILMQNYDIYE